MRPITFILAFLVSSALHTAAQAQPGGVAGAFTRLGFGARGIGMGNAMTAIPSGTISAHYNPALTPFQTGRVLHGSYGMLALDRRLNQVSYTQSIRLKKPGSRSEHEDDIVSIAGVSAGWINAGDADIQGYDSDGFTTGMQSMFENQFYLNFGNRFSQRFAAGFNVKFYYSGFNVNFSRNGTYSGVTSSGFGIDLGALYSVTDRFHIALVLQDLLTEYKWDTGPLYGPERGNSTEDAFARVVRLGASYALAQPSVIVACDVESYGSGTYLLRAGAEWRAAEQFLVRAGLDRLDLGGSGIDARPAFGFTVMQPVGVFTPEVSYAVVLEPVAPQPTHVLSFALRF